VYERTPHALDSRGGGIVLQPDVERALEFAGLREGLALGVVSKERIFLERSGAIVHRVPSRQTLTSWPMLYNTMRNAIPESAYHLNARLVDIEEDSGSVVTAVFADGQRASADLLIGADGVNSTVRALKMAASRPEYAGYVAWRGLVAEGELDEVTAACLTERFVFHQFPGSHILQYLIPATDGSTEPGRRFFNWVWYRNVPHTALAQTLTDKTGVIRPTSVPPGFVQDRSVKELHEAANALLAPQMASLVLATKDPFIQSILDVSVDRMVFGRVVLTGDAAFVPRPHTAASTSKAASNALDLAQALKGADDRIEDALRLWERDQLQLGTALKWHGQRLGNQSQFPERVV